MRVARFSLDDEPRFAVVGTDGDSEFVAVLKGDPLYAGYELTGQKLPLDEVRLLAPVIPRSKVIGIAKNYADHAAEMDASVPAEPLMFLKPNTSVIGPGDPIVHPKASERVDFEGELAVVIGRICKDVAPADVAKVVFGYTVANDVTARDLQAVDAQWARAKGFDTFCPLGPWIETDFDPAAARITTELDGRVVQDAPTSDMVFAVPDLIAYVSSFMTLLPGDVILTGTPAGIGPMVPGQTVSVTVAGIGTLTNRMVADE